MTLYSLVIGLVLIFPWSLVIVVLLGASSSALRHRLGVRARPFRLRRREPALRLLKARRGQSLIAGGPVGP